MPAPKVDKHDQGVRIAETILVGCMLKSPHTNGPDDHDLAEKIAEAGVKGDWFDDPAYGTAFDDLMMYFRMSRERYTPEEAARAKVQEGNDPNDTANYEHFLVGCKAAQEMRRLKIDLLIREVKNRHRKRLAAKLYENFLNECRDGVAEDAIDGFRKSVMKDLADPGHGVIRDHDLMEDYSEVVSWMVDMKHHPEKYRGYECGIQAIDRRTNGGFRPGHLTVLVGKPGGYKTRTLINIAFGLWTKGFNVLYASLEMEHRLLEGMLLCRGSAAMGHQVSYSRTFQGQITESGDIALLTRLQKEMSEIEAKAGPEGARKEPRYREAKALHDRVADTLRGVDTTVPEWDDVSRLQAAKKLMGGRTNKLKIINAGQSKKIKLSQLERFVEEKQHEFKPHVVIIDYLALVAAENPRMDRRDLELGETCEYMRSMGEQMGFSVITAAQLRRAAIERIRKFGNETPEKASLSTDDVSDSNQIPATADNVFVLWPMPGDKLRLMCVKSRHTSQGDADGVELHINHDYCMVSDTDELNVVTSGKPYDTKIAGVPILGVEELGPRVDSDAEPIDVGQGDF